MQRTRKYYFLQAKPLPRFPSSLFFLLAMARCNSGAQQPQSTAQLPCTHISGQNLGVGSAGCGELHSKSHRGWDWIISEAPFNQSHSMILHRSPAPCAHPTALVHPHPVLHVGPNGVPDAVTPGGTTVPLPLQAVPASISHGRQLIFYRASLENHLQTRRCRL